ncbi:ATPase SWSAP1-like [Gigantopelta aegis]|uniref:ATPase SWSAP1-like n=1 Tax=Gigantopelta aegis TaxID=1735272 RepID=UPI001B88AFD9|nr:ATPase SWSAP1-like [Gigantopelta aegis]
MSTLVHMLPLISPWWSSAENLSDLGRVLLEDKRPVVLIGNKGSGKTSMLFQSAVTYASEGGTVVFICHQPLSQIPLTVHGMPSPDPSVLQSVRFLYMSDVKELVEFCASIHTRACLPSVIIVDNMDSYVHQLKGNCVEHAAAKLCAMLMDTANFIQYKSKKACLVVMSASDTIKSLPSILKQFNMNPVFIEKSDHSSSGKECKLLAKTSQSTPVEVILCINTSVITVKQLQFSTAPT